MITYIETKRLDEWLTELGLELTTFFTSMREENNRYPDSYVAYVKSRSTSRLVIVRAVRMEGGLQASLFGHTGEAGHSVFIKVSS